MRHQNKSVGKQRRISLLLQSEGQKVKNKVKQIGKFRYSFDKKGRMQTGWQIFGSKKLIFPRRAEECRSIKSKRCQDRKKWLCKTEQDGAEGTKVLEKAKQILAKITTSKMSKSQKLYAAFQYMTSRANFSYRTWRGFYVYDGWEYDYALKCTKREPETATISHVDLPCSPKQSAISHRSLPAVSWRRRWCTGWVYQTFPGQDQRTLL